MSNKFRVTFYERKHVHVQIIRGHFDTHFVIIFSKDFSCDHQSTKTITAMTTIKKMVIFYECAFMTYPFYFVCIEANGLISLTAIKPYIYFCFNFDYRCYERGNHDGEFTGL